MPAKTLMVQGTMSSAGKSLLVTGLCRLFARRGRKVAPFKAQNMSNNAAVCADGGEIGRAQFTQALAANIQPTVSMNPVLLKPESDSRSQVIVMGRPWQTLPAASYYERKQALWQQVTTALDHLRSQYELVIIEGAGSPVELNLKRGDIVNMAVARYAQSPVLLVGDIDRGGIFAQMLGTLMLFDAEERALVKGLVVNKFRGDRALFADGVRLLEERGGVPVLGVLPYIRDLRLPDEDAVALDNLPAQTTAHSDIDIAVIHLPHIANFDDFDPLIAESGVHIRYVNHAEQLGKPHAVILPGTKSTIADLGWLCERGLANALTYLAAQKTALVGICGGYQMLGKSIHDPQHIEARQDSVEGLGLLPVTTTFAAQKATHQTQARIIGAGAWLRAIEWQTISGYEIHMGRTDSDSRWLEFERGEASTADGAMTEDGRIWGCYLHGVFANDDFRQAWLHSLGWQPQPDTPTKSQNAFDALADHLETYLDVAHLGRLIGD